MELRNYGIPWLYTVHGKSMSPTLESDDVLLVSRLHGRGDALRRGDIVVVDAPDNSSGYYTKIGRAHV